MGIIAVLFFLSDHTLVSIAHSFSDYDSVMEGNNDGSPFSQRSPVKPSPHVQFPETDSHTPPLLQLQCWEQSTPYRPGAQSEHTHTHSICTCFHWHIVMISYLKTNPNVNFNLR